MTAVFPFRPRSMGILLELLLILLGSTSRHHGVLLPYDLPDQKHVREQRAQMNGGIQVVDELRTDDRLGENQLNGGERVAGVAVQNRKERAVFLGGLQALLLLSTRQSSPPIRPRLRRRDSGIRALVRLPGCLRHSEVPAPRRPA